MTNNFDRARPVMFLWTNKEFIADIKWILNRYNELIDNTSVTKTFMVDCVQAEIASVITTHRHENIVLSTFHRCLIVHLAYTLQEERK